MRKSTIDLARECGAFGSTEYPYRGKILMTAAQLDAFAERIRADERTALASAPVQPLVLVKAKPVVRPVFVDVCMKEMRAAFIDVTIHAQSAYAVLDYIATLESALRQALEGKS